MTNLKYLVYILGISFVLGSCAKPEEPTPVQILTGEWEVAEVMAAGEVKFPEDMFLDKSRLQLENNESYLFITVDGRYDAGTWSADADALTLTSKDGGVTVLNISYMNFERLNAFTSFDNEITGEVEVRYLFERVR